MIDDATWIAARKAYSLAHRELQRAVLDAAYDTLPEPLRALRKVHDHAQEYLLQIQRERVKAGRRVA